MTRSNLFRLARSPLTLLLPTLAIAAFPVRAARADDGASAPPGRGLPALPPPPPTPPAPPPPPTTDGETVKIEIAKPVTMVVRQQPRTITDWSEGEPIPEGYHPVQRVRVGAVVGGVVPFTVLYFFSLLDASATEDSSHGTNKTADGLFIPGIGPFIMMTQTSSSVGNVFLAFDGLIQTGGLVLAVWGFASPRTILRRDDPAAALRFVPRPMLVGRDGAGFGWSGAF